VFEILNLEEAGMLDPKWMQDPPRLCKENGAFVHGGVGLFGLVVMASVDLHGGVGTISQHFCRYLFYSNI
jgi:beta-fructofuranosidase